MLLSQLTIITKKKEQLFFLSKTYLKLQQFVFTANLWDLREKLINIVVSAI